MPLALLALFALAAAAAVAAASRKAEPAAPPGPGPGPGKEDPFDAGMPELFRAQAIKILQGAGTEFSGLDVERAAQLYYLQGFTKTALLLTLRANQAYRDAGQPEVATFPPRGLGTGVPGQTTPPGSPPGIVPPVPDIPGIKPPPPPGPQQIPPGGFTPPPSGPPIPPPPAGLPEPSALGLPKGGWIDGENDLRYTIQQGDFGLVIAKKFGRGAADVPAMVREPRNAGRDWTKSFAGEAVWLPNDWWTGSRTPTKRAGPAGPVSQSKVQFKPKKAA